MVMHVKKSKFPKLTQNVQIVFQKNEVFVSSRAISKTHSVHAKVLTKIGPSEFWKFALQFAFSEYETVGACARTSRS